MSTVVIIGSPRKGNSETIALAMAEGAKENGNAIKTYYLNKMKNVKGCQSCYGCKKTGKCVVKDDQSEILEALRDADSIILSTPTYFGQPSAQYRMLEDRFFGFLNGDFSRISHRIKKLQLQSRAVADTMTLRTSQNP